MRDFIYRGRRIHSVGFFGYGRSNLGVKEYLEKIYGTLEYTLRADGDITADEGRGFGRVLCAGAAYDEPYEDVIFVTPAVRRDREGLLKMEERGVMLSSDAEICTELAKIPIFAVSGSDGKSTTVTLASKFLDAPAIGNIGVAMSPILVRSEVQYAVAELSSFQLLWQTPRTKRAVITNISPNHLDWHRSYGEYISAKENLLKNAEERVFNLDCEISRELLGRYSAYAVYSTKMSAKEMIKAARAEVYVGLDGEYIAANGVKILHTGAMQVKSRHNIANAVCAIALTHGYVERERILRVASEFRGLRHRCESVGNFGGVCYINSSIDSTPKRTATTLYSLSGEWIVILGGRNKGLDYRELIEPLRARARLAVLTGESGKEIEKILCEAGIKCVYEPDFRVAVELAASLAIPGESVILSPASTSFDSFSSFEERGNYFKEIIRNLHNEDLEK